MNNRSSASLIFRAALPQALPHSLQVQQAQREAVAGLAVLQLTGHNAAELATVGAQSVPLHTAAKCQTSITLNVCEDGRICRQLPSLGR